MIISKKVSFSAAHYLPNYVGKCHNVHGHCWVVELAISGQVMPIEGYVVDFSALKQWLQEHVIDIFDHRLVNDVIENPTAERIAAYIKNDFLLTIYEVSKRVEFAYVRVWETDTSMVELH